MNRSLSGLIIGSMLAFVLSGAPAALAQTESRTTTVKERPRPELDALGVKRGGFTLFPSLEVGETYKDNIFGAQTGTKDDFITTITPALRIASDWNQHAINFTGSGDIVRYATYTKEDNETYILSTDGRLDIRRDTQATAGLGYEKGSEERGSVDDAGGTTPTEFNVMSLNAGISNKWNRVSLKGDGSFDRRDFDDVTTVSAAGVTGNVNNDDRDRDEYKLDIRGGYEIQERYEAFVQLILTSINYDAAVDDAGVNRDNEGYEIRGGARIDLTGLLFGDVYVGYLSRDYEGATLNSVDAFVAGIDLTWNVTPLTTIKAGLSRDVSETTLALASGNLTTAFNTSVDHELLRNLIISARAGISKDEFEGTAREDDYIKAGLAAKYMLNRYFSVVFDYDHSERDSSAVGADNEINTFLLRLRAQL